MLAIELLYGPEILLLNIYPKEKKTQKPVTEMLVTVLFPIAQT